MITKLKLLSMTLLAAIAASATPARAAAAATAVTNATVWNDITVAFTVFSQSSPYLSTNKAGSLITAKTGQSSFTTKTLLEAVAADTGDGFDPGTSKLVTAKSYADTNVYTVVDLLNMTTNYYDLPVFAGMSNEVYVTVATNLVFTNTTSQLEVVDNSGNVYPLTNGHFNFSFTSYSADASEKAVGGVPVTGTETGTSFGIGSLTVSAVTNWVFGSASGFGTATLKPENLQTSKNPLYVDVRNSSSAVAGAGYTGGTLTTNATGGSVPTNYTIVVVKGTLSESFWKVLVNQ
jgi:hypothetical protein